MSNGGKSTKKAISNGRNANKRALDLEYLLNLELTTAENNSSVRNGGKAIKRALKPKNLSNLESTSATDGSSVSSEEKTTGIAKKLEP